MLEITARGVPGGNYRKGVCMGSGNGARRPSSSRQNHLDAGIQRLRAGQLAEGWICREFLGLDGDPTVGEVIGAVHDHLHTARKLSTAEGDLEAIAAVMAASALFKGGLRP